MLFALAANDRIFTDVGDRTANLFNADSEMEKFGKASLLFLAGDVWESCDRQDTLQGRFPFIWSRFGRKFTYKTTITHL